MVVLGLYPMKQVLVATPIDIGATRAVLANSKEKIEAKNKITGGNGKTQVIYPVRTGHQERIFPAYIGKYHISFMLLRFLE